MVGAGLSRPRRTSRTAFRPPRRSRRRPSRRNHAGSIGMERDARSCRLLEESGKAQCGFGGPLPVSRLAWRRSRVFRIAAHLQITGARRKETLTAILGLALSFLLAGPQIGEVRGAVGTDNRVQMEVDVFLPRFVVDLEEIAAEVFARWTGQPFYAARWRRANVRRGRVPAWPDARRSAARWICATSVRGAPSPFQAGRRQGKRAIARA